MQTGLEFEFEKKRPSTIIFIQNEHLIWNSKK